MTKWERRGLSAARVTRIRDRQHIDLLLLAVAGTEPANGREFLRVLHERSGGVVALSEQTVYHELHRLTKDRLIAVTWQGGSRRYLRTPLGERILAARRREWEMFSRGLDRVLAGVHDS